MNRSVSSLIYLLSGVYGTLCVFRGIAGVAYSRGIVYFTISTGCFLLWALWEEKRRYLFTGILLAAIFSAIVLIFQSPEVNTQAGHLAFFMRTSAAEGAIDITELVLVCGVCSSCILFLFEFVIRSHWIPLFFTAAMLLLAPMSGIGLRADMLLALVIFQTAFWAMQRSEKNTFFVKSGDEKETKRPAGKKLGAAAAVFSTGAFAISFVVCSILSEPLFDAAYQVEGAVNRLFLMMSGQETQTVSGGAISRGNLYQTHRPQMELFVSRKPQETLYLRGFCGGNYTGEGWDPETDQEILEKVETILDWGQWTDLIDGMYHNMYFVMNESMKREAKSEPISLIIRYLNGTGGMVYEPYYSLGERKQEETYNRGRYQYYERADLAVDWENIKDELREMGEWYHDIETVYLQQAQNIYTQVPEESLPGLTETVRENPQSGIENITGFIQTFLWENAVYSLRPGWASRNEDIIETFLFRRHSGYCAHFASAAVLMYRMYGIPARYVAGFAAAPEEFVQQEDGSYRAVLTDANAHAWPEIFLPTYGWMPVEATPPAENHAALFQESLIESEGLADERGQKNETSSSGAIEDPSYTVFPDEEESESGRDRFFDRQKKGNWHMILVCTAYTLCLMPFCLDYRRMRMQAKLNQMNCREIFGRFMEMLRFCKKADQEDGQETDFVLQISEWIPELPAEDAKRFMEYVHAAAFGPEAESPEHKWFVFFFYRNAAEALYREQNRYRKVCFKYIKGF